MTIKDQLNFCKKCLNRKMDLKQGIICGLTSQKPSFNTECPDFKLDGNVTLPPADNTEALPLTGLKVKLPPEILERLRLEQKLFAAILSGLIVGIVGAILWGAITVATKYQIGYMALAIGAGVGITIRFFGKGIDPVFGIWGAVISLFSVILGNIFSIVGFIAANEGLGIIETLNLIDFSHIPELLAETFSPIDLLFYGIAVYEGYRFSFRQITEKNIEGFKSVYK